MRRILTVMAMGLSAMAVQAQDNEKGTFSGNFMSNTQLLSLIHI